MVLKPMKELELPKTMEEKQAALATAFAPETRDAVLRAFPGFFVEDLDSYKALKKAWNQICGKVGRCRLLTPG